MNEYTFSDLRCYYQTGRSYVVSGEGRNRVYGYRTGVQCELGDIERDEWIIDGNYGSTIEWRIEACDILFFLDYPAEVCLAGVRARRGQKRSDMPWVEEGDDEEFLDFIRAFESESKPRILELIEKYPEKTVVTFRTREEAELYLRELDP